MKKLKSVVRVMFGRNSASRHDDLIRHWAQVEYKKDWEYAYHHMREHGSAPRYISIPHSHV